ncbi:endonuclease/exonuclease/phosphatase family protein [Streptomyces sp. NPDC002643]
MTGRRRGALPGGAAAIVLTVLLGVLLGVALVLVALPDEGRGGVESIVEPRDRELRVVHYNLCGAAAACPWNAGGSGPGTSIARLVEEASRFEADIVTVNEICLTQYAELKRQLAEADWRMDGTYASSQDNVPACGGGNSTTGRFGSAVLSRENVPDDRQTYLRFTDTAGETYTNGGRTVEVHRGLLCADTRFEDRPLIACTAHTNAKAPGQLREIRAWLADTNRFPYDTPMIVAGDLNLPPTALALAHLTEGFVEADEADQEPTADGRKIDYIFADRHHFTAEDGDAAMHPESDHALLTGRFTLNQVAPYA